MHLHPCLGGFGVSSRKDTQHSEPKLAGEHTFMHAIAYEGLGFRGLGASYTLRTSTLQASSAQAQLATVLGPGTPIKGYQEGHGKNFDKVALEGSWALALIIPKL